jgi:hypothetical protein
VPGSQENAADLLRYRLIESCIFQSAAPDPIARTRGGAPYMQVRESDEDKNLLDVWRWWWRWRLVVGGAAGGGSRRLRRRRVAQ